MKNDIVPFLTEFKLVRKNRKGKRHLSIVGRQIDRYTYLVKRRNGIDSSIQTEA